jgi:hypothetical protein
MPDGGGENGMSIRDWFAGQALPAVIAATSAGQHFPGDGFNDERPIPVRMAHDAYAIADAMLALRAKATPVIASMEDN